MNDILQEIRLLLRQLRQEALLDMDVSGDTEALYHERD